MEIGTLIHYLSSTCTIIFPFVGTALGQGLASRSMLNALDEQPQAAPQLKRTFLLGLALSETAAILSAVVGGLMFVAAPAHPTLATALAELGVFAAMAIPATIVGFLSSLPLRATLASIARQPLFTSKISNLMIITISIMQTSVILGLLVSLFIRTGLASVVTMDDGIKLLASGLAMGLGCIGPLIGLSLFSQKVCTMAGYNRDAYQPILTFTFIAQAFIETPILFSLLISLVIVSNTTAPTMALLAAALAMGLGTLGPGISSGKIATTACTYMGESPQLYAALSRTSVLAQGLIDASVIYALLVALILIYGT